MQFSLFDQAPRQLQRLPIPDAQVWFCENWLANDEASTLYASLKEQLPWVQDTIRLYGKSVKIPRLQSWHGEPHCEYQYSGLTMRPKPMTTALLSLANQCSDMANAPFNCVLANWYRNGNDSMGMHADNEPELGDRPVIASVSLGESRRFVFQHLTTKARYPVILTHGSLLIMAGATQQCYHHGIAKTTKPLNGRINLTYRYIK